MREGVLFSWEKTTSGDPNSTYEEVINKTEPGTSEQCLVGGQDNTDINLNST